MTPEEKFNELVAQLDELQARANDLGGVHGTYDQWVGANNLPEVCRGLSVQQDVRLLARFKQLYETLDDVKKEVGKAYDRLRKEVVSEAMEEEDTPSIRVQGVGNCSLRGDMYVSVSDKQALFEWLEEVGQQDLIREEVNAQQLKSTLKKRLEAGEELPEHCVKVTPYSMAVITK